MKNLYSISKGIVATTTVTLTGLGFITLTSGTAEAITFGTTWDSPDKCADVGTVSVPTTCSLQDLFDSQTVSGPGIDAEDDTGFEWFTNTATGNATGSFMFEVAGFAPHNQFGIYNSAGDQIRLFDGVNDEGDSTFVTFLAGGKVSRITQQFAPDADDATPVFDTFEDFGNEFGFYLTNKKGETFYTQSAKNDGGYQQAAVYQGDNETVMELPGKAPGTFTDNEFIIAFEDLFRGGNSDSDFNDLVVMMESIEPVDDIPEPSMLLGLGILGASFWSMRRRDRI
ncbi:PEP-CTERM sorting domain-containing protein [Roseofilum casamattae]|uniref:PEP-CTERM sorting domain-containing protein n=1 Tax=Roseofilum casamattae BLCC-M143 TaxID=3022442 RepID=A0ABT7BRD5_9CYAN|nr:PEP-CTERM sorting domain-containing protein [Roseofilum casamattae]MDJ1181755.1 PEP-CTERM sorting domain-containing protein [Roseofilum casamattae BLCC-M143]